MKNLKRYYGSVLLLLLFTHCGKDFLDAKRESHQLVPVSIADYAALVTNYSVFNWVTPIRLALIGSDEFTVSDQRYNAINEVWERNAYIWAEDVFEGADSRDWNTGYQQVLNANMALEVRKIKPTAAEEPAWKQVQGAALFLRAQAFFQLAQLFTPQYSPELGSRTGIPIRLDYDVQAPVNWGTLDELYARIFEDLGQALTLLPKTVANKYEASQWAVHALLARIHLQLGNYTEAQEQATLALVINKELLDFGSVNPGNLFTFPQNFGQGNPEIIFYQTQGGMITNFSRMNTNEQILSLYEDNDLRRFIYFAAANNGRIYFKGSYNGGSGGYFVGLATDELYLIQAECLARLGEGEKALEALNALLEKRYDHTFVHLAISEPKLLLDRILLERRKELFFRGLRWYDMKRLDKEPDYARDYYRVVNDTRYTLLKNSDNWVWPLPDNEVKWSPKH